MRTGSAGLALVAALLLPLPVGAAESESTCIRCHAEEEDPDLSAPVEQWRRSVHAEAEVSCDGCHGGDPFEEDEELSMDEEAAFFIGAPGWTEVPDFCGTCHEDILDAYSQSVMASKIAEGEEVAVCTTCHMVDGHAIANAVPREILTEERCGECHDPDRAHELLELLEDVDLRIDSARAELDPIRDAIDTSALDREIDEIRQRHVVIAHTYDRERISEVAHVARQRLESVTASSRELADEARFRRRLGVGVVGFLLVACLGVVRLGGDVRGRGSQ